MTTVLLLSRALLRLCRVRGLSTVFTHAVTPRQEIAGALAYMPNRSLPLQDGRLDVGLIDFVIQGRGASREAVGRGVGREAGEKEKERASKERVDKERVDKKRVEQERADKELAEKEREGYKQ